VTPGAAQLQGFPDLGRTRVMAVLNVTPDSFSDGGDNLSADDAVRHGLTALQAGADLLDVGGESTRPGAQRVDEAQERARVVPVVERLAAAGAVLSVDTMRAAVAGAALDAGAQLVNDVSGGLADPGMLALVAERQVPLVVMHWRGHSADMAARARYLDVVTEVCDELRARLDACVRAGIEPGRVLVDPGLGFAKDAGHNWALLRALPVLAGLGCPLLLGASRKAFLGAALAGADGAARPARGRDAATAAVTVLAAQVGAWAVRVHDVGPSADAVRVVAAAQ
jgi:dihydropteroate synthase